MWKNIKETLLLIILASACIWGLHYMITKYEPPICGNSVVIVTDSDGNKKLYKDKLPPHSVLRGSKIQTINCFKPVEIIDTVSMLTNNGNIIHLAYHINCNLSRDIFENYNIDILQNINSNFDKCVKDANGRIKYLCVSIPVRYGPRAEEYISKNLKNDIKWILIHDGFNVNSIEITEIRKES